MCCFFNRWVNHSDSPTNIIYAIGKKLNTCTKTNPWKPYISNSVRPNNFLVTNPYTANNIIADSATTKVEILLEVGL